MDKSLNIKLSQFFKHVITELCNKPSKIDDDIGRKVYDFITTTKKDVELLKDCYEDESRPLISPKSYKNYLTGNCESEIKDKNQRVMVGFILYFSNNNDTVIENILTYCADILGESYFRGVCNTVAKSKGNEQYALVKAVLQETINRIINGSSDHEHRETDQLLTDEETIRLTYNQGSTNWTKIDDNFLKLHQTIKTGELRGFISGKKCSWSLIINHSIVERDTTKEAFEQLEERDIVGIFGAGGEGKSTILMQLCENLYANNYDVYYDEGRNRASYGFDIRKESSKEIAFIIDNASINSSFEEFVLYCLGQGIKVVFACRSNEWYMAKLRDSSNLLERELYPIQIKKISDNEAEKFADLLINNNALTATKDEIKAIFLKESNGFLLSSMLIAVHGKPLESIIADVLSEIEKFNADILKVLSMVCFTELFGLKMHYSTYEKCYREYKIKKREINSALDQEIQIQINRNFVETRHPEISKIALNYLLFDDKSYFSLTDILQDFINCLSDKNPLPLSNLNIIKNILKYTYENNYLDDARRLYSTVLEDHADIGNLWEEWAKYEIDKGNIGVNVNEKYTARWIFKNASDKCPNYGKIWTSWANLEIQKENIGKDVTEENTARWIFKQGSEKCFNYGHIWTSWANLEIDKKNIGKDVTEENTARWIFKLGSDECPRYGDIWIEWAALEMSKGNIGKDVTEANTARWIFKQGSDKCPSYGNIWIEWAPLEMSKGNIGKDVTEANTARWILKQASKECPKNEKVWREWVDLELNKENIGKDVTEENSARWILKHICEKEPLNGNSWMTWANLEIDKNNIGKDVTEENSARWILKQASKACHKDGKIWVLRAKLEIDKKNIGKDVTEENTARWILKKATEMCSRDGSVWQVWARLELNNDNIGKDVSEENTARWIFKQGSENCPRYGGIWFWWADLEISKKNIGKDFTEENTARWIFNQGTNKLPNYSLIWAKWALFEKDYDISSAVNILAESLIKKNHNQPYLFLLLLALLQASNDNFDPNDNYSATNIIELLLEKYNIPLSLYIAYLCNKLYHSSEIAQIYEIQLIGMGSEVSRFDNMPFFKERIWEKNYEPTDTFLFNELKLIE